MGEKGFRPEQLRVLMQAASARLGKDPNQLRQELESGSWDSVLAAAGTNREGLQQLLQDRSKVESVLRSPQAQALLRELMAKGR